MWRFRWRQQLAVFLKLILSPTPAVLPGHDSPSSLTALEDQTLQFLCSSPKQAEGNILEMKLDRLHPEVLGPQGRASEGVASTVTAIGDEESAE